MQRIQGISRQQLQLSSLEDKISLENPVRFMEAFVEYISLELLGFKTSILKSEGIVPNYNYHSISDFRKNNPSGLKKMFKLFVSFLKDADLIAGETIAIDGTKSRAHNSKKDNFSDLQNLPNTKPYLN
ncbi:hypothetical protein [Flavobacterium polysaccharolyticum]|uniref:Transposase n=1 Tax=Flavobacterium polysaccharolyticum TaxID=3133148 RepID=A0ABU9NKK7_9FLAO